MKKLVLLSLFVVAMATAAFAQPRAIGARIGYGIEASYQHSLSEANMVTVDFGLVGLGLEAAATYDWLNPGGLMIPWEEKGSWNWYAGVGAGAGIYFGGPVGFVGAAGRVGVEYNFWFPLQLSVDWRPIIGVEFGDRGDYGPVGCYYDGLYAGGIAIGARYIF